MPDAIFWILYFGFAAAVIAVTGAATARVHRHLRACELPTAVVNLLSGLACLLIFAGGWLVFALWRTVRLFANLLTQVHDFARRRPAA